MDDLNLTPAQREFVAEHERMHKEIQDVLRSTTPTRVDVAPAEHTYVAFYRGRQTTVQAPTSYAAQTKAAAFFKARKQYEVTVVLADKPISTASLG